MRFFAIKIKMYFVKLFCYCIIRTNVQQTNVVIKLTNNNAIEHFWQNKKIYTCCKINPIFSILIFDLLKCFNTFSLTIFKYCYLNAV